ncbi:hypothetical protein D3C74_338120 [compost metagenome]
MPSDHQIGTGINVLMSKGSLMLLKLSHPLLAPVSNNQHQIGILARCLNCFDRLLRVVGSRYSRSFLTGSPALLRYNTAESANCDFYSFTLHIDWSKRFGAIFACTSMEDFICIQMIDRIKQALNTLIKRMIISKVYRINAGLCHFRERLGR